MSAKGVVRKVKNYTKGYSHIQTRARDATSNDPDGPSGSVMQELAQATYNQTEFLEVMEMIDKRLNDKGKNWRHVFKALVVSDYLAHMGSDYVVDYMVDNIYIIKTLREFQHIDEGGRDRGADVRQRAKELYALLLDRPRLAKERKDKGWANKYGGGGMGWGGGYNDRYASSSGRLPGSGSRYNNDRPGDRHGRTSSYSHSSSRYNENNRFGGGRSSGNNRHGVPKNYDEDAELKKAIEESAREAKQEEEKRKSQQQASNTGTGAGAGAGSGGGEVDLLGGFDDIASNNNNFGSTGNLGMSGGNNSMAMMSNTSFSQQPQQQMGNMPTSSAASDLMGAFGNNNNNSNSNSNFDPFGLNTNNSTTNSQHQQMMAMSTSMSGVGMGMGMSSPYDTANSNNMFSSSSNQVFTQTTITTGSTPNPFGGIGAGGQSNIFDSHDNTAVAASGSGGMSGMGGMGGMGGVAGSGGTGGNNNDLLGMSTSSAGAFDGASGAFGSAFDGGQSAKTLPFGVNPNDPNSRLAEIARNSDKIDPFASLAMGSTSGNNPFGGTPSTSQPTMMGSTTAGAGMTSSPFGSGTPNMSTAGGSSLVDLSPAALSSGGGSQQTFGQVNRNPFAQNQGVVQQGKQPSMNQLISSNTTQAMSVSSFSQQPSSNMMGGMQQATSPQQQQQSGNPFAQPQQQNNNIFGL